MDDRGRTRHAREVALFERAIELPSGERAAFLAQECADDPALREAVEGLIAADDPERATLDWHVGLAGTATGSDEGSTPKDFGGFEILRTLGRGGMGVVYLARQRSTGREVALKVIRPELLGQSQTRRRFQREVEAVSRLDHPGICTVYEAGEVEGVPYVAMQYVAGETMAEVLRQRSTTATPPASEHPSADLSSSTRRSLDSILLLFEKIASGLDAAHESGVLHRDIKPHNLMIDARGEPTILDFGLARAEDGSGERLTISAAQLGTPAYMSPEQIEGLRSIDRRTDVYSLGVTLHEFVTGEHPFDAPTREQMYQRILGGRAPTLDKVCRHASRDLAIVVRTAMARDADQRYETAQAFADDLRRVRLLEPIRARRPSVPERLVRWCRREPVLASLVAALLLITATAVWLAVEANTARRAQEQEAQRASESALEASAQATKAEREAENARLEAATAERVATFLVDLFRIADGSEYRGSTITAREVLDQGFRLIDVELRDEPLIRARLMATMGQVYQHLSDFDRAAELSEQSLALRREHGARPRAVARSLRDLGEVHHYREDYATAERNYRAALDTLRKAGFGDDHDVATTLDLIGRLKRQTGDLDEAGRLHDEAFAMRRRLPEDPLELANSHQSRALLSIRRNDADTAVEEFRTAIATRERELGGDSGQLPELLHGLAHALMNTGDLESARSALDDALERTRKVYGDHHHGVGRCLALLGNLCADAGQLEAAERYYEQATAVFVVVFGEESREVATQLHNRGTLAFETDDLDLAGQLLTQAFTIRERILPNDHPDLGFSLLTIGTLDARRSDLDAAIEHFRRAYEILIQVLPQGHPYLGIAAGRLADCLERKGDPEAATWRSRAR